MGIGLYTCDVASVCMIAVLDSQCFLLCMGTYNGFTVLRIILVYSKLKLYFHLVITLALPARNNVHKLCFIGKVCLKSTIFVYE